MKKNDVVRSPLKRALIKYIIMMKVLWILVMASVLQVTAGNIESYSQGTRMNLRLKGASLEEVIWTMKKQSEFNFFYNSDDVNEVNGLNLKCKDATAEEILTECLDKTDLTFEIVNKAVIIKKVAKPIPKISEIVVEQGSEQGKKVTGQVVDEKGEPIPGTTILVKGKTIGTVADFQGNFSLNVPPDSKILVFSFVGYNSQEVPIGTLSQFKIVLKEITIGVGEVVVVGYGAQKKESVVGAISQTSGEQLQKMKQNEVANSMTGLITGLVTVKTTDLPGGFNTGGLGMPDAANYDKKTKIYLRGQSTWNGGEPLVLVDGVERSIDNLDASEVESISVLKDASATAVFGVRGANGVILVTTKRGKESKPTLTFDVQHGLSFTSKIQSTLNSYDANEFKNRVIVNELAVSPSSWSYYVRKRYLDYYKTQQYPELFPDVRMKDLMLKDFANSSKYSASLSGGTRFFNYFGTVNYTHDEGIIKGEDFGTGYTPAMDYDRLNVRNNLDFQFTPSTKVALNIFGSYNKQSDINAYGNNWRIWTGIYQRPSDLIPIRYSDGTFAENGTTFPNAYAMLNYGGKDFANRVQYTSDIRVTQQLDKITKGLSASASVSYDNSFVWGGPRISGTSYITKYIDPRYVDAKTDAERASWVKWSIPSTSTGYNWVMPPTSYAGDNVDTNSAVRLLNYEFKLNYQRIFDKHSVSALALMTRQEGAVGGSFPTKRESWVGRVTYDYDGRYFVEGNAGYNGSEKFDRKYRFGLFPSIGFNWMISNEKFFKDAFSWWSKLKVRYSYGLVGSDAGIDRWLYLSSWSVADASRDRIFGYPTGQPSGYHLSEEGAIPNPDIHWETAKKQNLGLEFGFFADKLRASIELWNDNRYDMLIASSARANNVLFGANLPPANLGKTETKGYEVELMYDKLFSNGFNISLKATHSFAKDKILFRDDPELRPAYQKLAGYQIDQTRTFVNSGIIQSWDDLYTTVLDKTNASRLPGDFKNVDFNADGVIDQNDVIPYGYPSRPQHNYTFTFGFGYKGIELTALFVGSYNVTVSESYYLLFPATYSVAFPWHKADAFMPEYGQTQSATLKTPRFLSSGQTSYLGQYDLIDGSYLKLQNVELAYRFNEKLTKRIGVGNLKIYVSGNNLFFRSKLRENREGSGTAQGYSLGSYPILKKVSFGLSLGF